MQIFLAMLTPALYACEQTNHMKAILMRTFFLRSLKITVYGPSMDTDVPLADVRRCFKPFQIGKKKLSR